MGFLNHISYFSTGKKTMAIKNKFLHVWNSFRYCCRRKVINKSGLFNIPWYLEQNPDVKKSNISPLLHYIMHGEKEGRRPSSVFDTSFYLKRYYDVKKYRMGPLAHYIMYGENEGRKVSPNIIISGHQLYPNKAKLVFVSHDASRTGAPLFLVNLLQNLKKDFSLQIILLEGGPLIDEFEQCGKVLHLYTISQVTHQATLESFVTDDSSAVYFNTIVSAGIIDFFSYLDSPKFAYIHEMGCSLELYRESLQKILDSQSHIILASKYTHRLMLEKYGVNKSRMTVLRPFLSKRSKQLDLTNKVALREILGLRKNAFLVLGAGTLCERKNPEAFIKLAQQVCSINDDIDFIWLGEGLAMSKLQKLVAKYGLRDRVQFLGYKPNIMEYFSIGDMFFLSSKEDPCPQVCLEAASFNLPIFSFKNTGDISAIFDDGAGVSAVLGDLAVLKSALINLYSNKSLQHAWGEEANRRVFEKFNKSTYLKRFHEMNAMYLKNSKYLEFKQL